MTDTNVLLLTVDDGVATLQINRPQSLNTLGAVGDGAAFRTVCDRVNADPEIRCAILTGAGKAFSAGGDVKAMRARTGVFAGDGAAIRGGYRREIHGLSRALYGLEVPLVAAVNGPAIGLGCDVACLADLRLASDRASFAVTFLKVGLIPGDGGAWLLPRVVGHAKAAEMLFTGESLDATAAAACGLVSRVVPHDELMAAATTLARRIAAQPGQALRLAKSLLRQGRESSYDQLMELSATAQALCHLSSDHVEGLDAVLERRPPRFHGRS
ncbi:MAG: crotonase/enoyl-CoA hydratase family protein [Steroidobacteraceae bacterium]|jgi:enoyl-CoA hydratase/carnithine racemase